MTSKKKKQLTQEEWEKEIRRLVPPVSIFELEKNDHKKEKLKKN